MEEKADRNDERAGRVVLSWFNLRQWKKWIKHIITGNGDAGYICYIAAIRGADILRRRGLLINGEPPRGLWLTGDSKSALSWAEKGRVKSERAVNASLACVMQSVKLNMPLLGIDHLPKEVNTSADGISRRAEGSLSLCELVDLDLRFV
ncbi:hypothetical protein B484DRAFT_409925, partial [Ochromonadaceae sp. CCMP2298]